VEEKTIRRSQESFTFYFFPSEFENPKLPHCWIVMEYLTFGECSGIFINIKHVENEKEISKIFEHHPTLIDSWIAVLNYSRNACAYHARL
jgi:abortive infection bacteriophage resistance protein